MEDATNSLALDLKRKKFDSQEETDLTSEKAIVKEKRTTLTTTSSSGDPYLQALTTAQQALDAAGEIGRERLKVISNLYYCGQETCQDPLIVDAQTLCDTSMAQVKALTLRLASKFDRVPIYKLPEEVMHHVFTHLDLTSLFACQDTCQTWKQVLATKLALKDVWREAPLLENGMLMTKTGMTRWEKLARLFRRIDKCDLKPPVFSLKMYADPDWSQLGTELARELERFPRKNLRDFTFMGYGIELWKHVARCPSLKILHWTSIGQEGRPWYCLYRQPSCRLEEVFFSVGLKATIDNSFVQMLSQVKRLHLKRSLNMAQIKAIFGAAQESLQDISIYEIVDQIDIESDGNLYGETESSFHMKNLHTISINSTVGGIFEITAPDATTVSFRHGTNVDWTLLDSCRHNIKSLHIELTGSETKGRFGQELFDMPQLEFLHLDYTRGGNTWSKGLITRFKDYSAAAFWEAIKKDDTTKMQSMLPSLKRLTITHDPLLEEESFLKYIEMRSSLGSDPIKNIKIYLADICSRSTSKLEAFRANTPGFSFKCFRDWSNTTMPWRWKTSLSYHDIYWDELDLLRKIARYLHIQTSHEKDIDERLQKEIFNMPQLLSLTLELLNEKARGRSVTALWTAYTTGDTNNPEVKLQDVLPRLKSLRVVNDTMLSVDILYKMMESRKQENLPALENMSIWLASRQTSECKRWESLKSTVKGFKYKTFEDWGYEVGLTPDPEDDEI